MRTAEVDPEDAARANRAVIAYLQGVQRAHEEMGRARDTKCVSDTILLLKDLTKRHEAEKSLNN